MFQNSQIIEDENRRRELAQLKEEIVNEVLNRLSLSLDVQEAISKIKELQDAIDGLTKK